MALKIPPLLQLIVALLLIRGVSEILPVVSAAQPVRHLLAELLGGLALAIATAGIVGFHRARTTIDPRYPERSCSLVTGGIYRLSRNPMYLGLVLLLIAYCLYLGSLYALAVVAGFILSMNRLQIEAEERALEASFGDAYRRYKERVRRWL